MVHERYREKTDRQTEDRQQTTDNRRTIAYSEREHEFNFAKNTDQVLNKELHVLDT